MCIIINEENKETVFQTITKNTEDEKVMNKIFCWSNRMCLGFGLTKQDDYF